mmetsp:Transcript_25580/g.64562  ORF Transcript_25580/g.64562 Transcript_25580/m.64562 type:complete len:272 (+) Transcript_25580:126-941(+)
MPPPLAYRAAVAQRPALTRRCRHRPGRTVPAVLPPPAGLGREAMGGHCRRETTARATSRSGGETLVKICGVVSPEDAQLATSMGADFIGMIVWPKAKRSVSADTAAQIAEVAHQAGAQAVGVFVDEDADTIAQRCAEAGIKVAQLHGDGARAALPGLPDSLKVIYVMHADASGAVQTPPPPIAVDWVLLDGLKGGSGETFEWTSLRVPTGASTEGWLLAGGLGPDNVAEAIGIAHPTGVDVSSGVAGPDGLKKDADKVERFIGGARGACGR